MIAAGERSSFLSFVQVRHVLLSKEPRHVESTTLAPWVEGAARFTATQSRLWEWVRGNLTRKRDSSAVDPVLTEIPGKLKKAGARRFTISPSADTSPR